MDNQILKLLALQGAFEGGVRAEVWMEFASGIG